MHSSVDTDTDRKESEVVALRWEKVGRGEVDEPRAHLAQQGHGPGEREPAPSERGRLGMGGGRDLANLPNETGVTGGLWPEQLQDALPP